LQVGKEERSKASGRRTEISAAEFLIIVG